MRVAVVHYDSRSTPRFKEIVAALAKGLERQGCDVTVVNGKTDSGTTLTGFGYIAVGCSSPSAFAKKPPEALRSFLRSAGHVSGKRCYAFIDNHGLRKGKVLGSLMKMMESEGMFLKKSDILANAAEAEAVGARLHIEKNKQSS